MEALQKLCGSFVEALWKLVKALCEILPVSAEAMWKLCGRSAEVQ